MKAFNDIKLNKISFLRTGGQSGVDRAVLGRPLLYFNPSENINKIVKWLNSFGNELTLNIGGPRLSEWPQGYTITIEILKQLFDIIGF